jgi:hypothetical protein
VARPSALAAVVLNDIGPALEARGLARLKTMSAACRNQLGRRSGVSSACMAVPCLSPADWKAFARMTWRDVDGSGERL